MVLTRSMTKNQSIEQPPAETIRPRRIRPRAPRELIITRKESTEQPQPTEQLTQKYHYTIRTEYDGMYSQFEADWDDEWFDRCCKRYTSLCAPVVHEIISNHPYLTWKTIQNNPTFPWDWYCVSYHKNITWEIVQENPTMPWKYYSMTANPNITDEIIKNNPDKGWNQNYIAQKYPYNPRTHTGTNTQVFKRILEQLLDNEVEKQKYIADRFRQWFRTSELKEELLAVVWHPDNFSMFQYLDPDFSVY